MRLLGAMLHFLAFSCVLMWSVPLYCSFLVKPNEIYMKPSNVQVLFFTYSLGNTCSYLFPTCEVYRLLFSAAASATQEAVLRSLDIFFSFNLLMYSVSCWPLAFFCQH